ncbi:GNAT family N-acetyltransferase [Candidatus Poseidoniaceae archaeon]|nr:GNAT family N-acetyltransferase [Candidatus Poseidoniaceae archaeon]
MGAQWHLGPSPKSLDAATVEIVKQLFLDQTGEVYSEASVKSLPIPEWDGNLVLLDQNKMLRGLLWTNKFSQTRVRIVAFAIDSDYKGQGFGAQAWEHLLVAARADGIKEVQLEVRGDNQFAIDFYRRRGLEIIMPLEGYYKAGIGYVMRGNI